LKVQETGFYEQQKVSTEKEIWVYQMPDKSVGYQVIERNLKDKTITSTGYGPEWEERSYTRVLKDKDEF